MISNAQKLKKRCWNEIPSWNTFWNRKKLHTVRAPIIRRIGFRRDPLLRGSPRESALLGKKTKESLVKTFRTHYSPPCSANDETHFGIFSKLNYVFTAQNAQALDFLPQMAYFRTFRFANEHCSLILMIGRCTLAKRFWAHAGCSESMELLTRLFHRNSNPEQCDWVLQC